MVIAHTAKAGQFAKDKAKQVTFRTTWWLMIGAFGLTTIGGFLSGYTLGQPMSLIAGFSAVAILLGFAWYFTRFADRYMDDASRQRLWYLRGGEAEAYTSMQLRKYLDDHWHLFDNVKLDASSDIDHVLVGPGGLFVISTKSQRGLFQCGGDNGVRSTPTFNNRSTDWCQDVVRQAMRLKDQLAVVTTVPSVAQPWVQTVLALPFAHIEPEGGICGPTWVVNEESLIAALEERDRKQRLSKQAIEQWVKAVETLQRRHAVE